MNPNPDYDASDELEYGIAAFAWLLRGSTRHRPTRPTWATPAPADSSHPLLSHCGGGT